MDKVTLAKAILCSLVQAYPDHSKVNEHYIPNSEYPGLCGEAIEIAEEMEKQLDIASRPPIPQQSEEDFAEENNFVDGLD